VTRIVVVAALVAALGPATSDASYHSSIHRLTSSQKSMLVKGGFWHRGCPVGLNDLRVLRVSHRGFDKHNHTGQMIVNRKAASALAKVFHRLYVIHFPIRNMSLQGVYGPRAQQTEDPTGSFECRQAVPSPCTGGSGTGSWSNHAYGLAVDLNPQESPYVGCGMSRDPKAQSYRDRSRHRPGMVTAQVRKAFASIGWGWGGSWSGNTKDYMHFSVNGH
jgi:hypothetical protein